MRRLFRNSVVARWGAAFLGPHFFASLATLPRYFVDWGVYKRSAGQQQLSFRDSYPCLTDSIKATPFDPHYFFQAAWLARRLSQALPSLHVDIGSSAMMLNVLSASAKTIFVDYRPLRVQLSNFIPLGGDIVHLPFRSGTIRSLSCLHVIEHVGLGRYGDPINPAGSQLAAVELQRVLQPGGRLFLSVPVGRERSVSMRIGYLRLAPFNRLCRSFGWNHSLSSMIQGDSPSRFRLKLRSVSITDAVCSSS